MLRREKNIMLQRRVVIVVTAVLSIIFCPPDALASGASHHSNSLAGSGSGFWSAGRHWSKKERRNAYWAFYNDLRYYADPNFYSECYRRIRIETLYGVSW